MTKSRIGVRGDDDTGDLGLFGGRSESLKGTVDGGFEDLAFVVLDIKNIY